METDHVLLEELEQVEGDSHRAYQDTRGFWTIGVGHCLTRDELTSGKITVAGVSVIWRNGLTENQLQCLLLQDLGYATAAVNSLITVPLTQYEFDALVSFTFNVGIEAFRNSTLRRLLNAGYYDDVPTQLRRWVHNHDGSICRGLVARREREIELWNGDGLNF
jgi:lysozyme